MIRDEGGHPKKRICIPSDLRDTMIVHIRHRIVRNLEALKEFIQIEGYEDICGGLYTYAVEEYGKILFLQSHSGSDIIKLKYDDKNGFIDHNDKFGRALGNIPESCKKLHDGEFSNEFSSEFNIDVLADFEARMTIFYADFKNENEILEIPMVDKPLLEKAIDDFLTFIKNQNQ